MFLFFKIPSLTEIINKHGYTTVKDPNNTAFVCIVNLTMKKRANHFPALLMLWNIASLFYISLLMNVYVFIWVSFMRQMLSSAPLCTCCSIQSGLTLREYLFVIVHNTLFIGKHLPKGRVNQYKYFNAAATRHLLVPKQYYFKAHTLWYIGSGK